MKASVGTADIHVTPDYRHLYASERSESYISHYLISDDGCELTLEARYPTEAHPRGFNIDNTVPLFNFQWAKVRPYFSF